MAALTSDIVWLVEQELTLADGSRQRVLVPQLYVRVRAGDVDGSGALLAGKEVEVDLAGDLTNFGTVAGRNVVRITAESIENLGGRMQGDQLGAQARIHLDHMGGTMSPNSRLQVSAGQGAQIWLLLAGHLGTWRVLRPWIRNAAQRSSPGARQAICASIESNPRPLKAVAWSRLDSYAGSSTPAPGGESAGKMSR